MSLFSYSQELVLLEINAKWNKNNSTSIKKIGDVYIKKTWLEDLPDNVKKSVKSVPMLILFKDGKNVYQWNAGLDLKLHIKEADILNIIENIGKDK